MSYTPAPWQGRAARPKGCAKYKKQSIGGPTPHFLLQTLFFSLKPVFTDNYNYKNKSQTCLNICDGEGNPFHAPHSLQTTGFLFRFLQGK